MRLSAFAPLSENGESPFMSFSQIFLYYITLTIKRQQLLFVIQLLKQLVNIAQLLVDIAQLGLVLFRGLHLGNRLRFLNRL